LHSCSYFKKRGTEKEREREREREREEPEREMCCIYSVCDKMLTGREEAGHLAC
jgi:hypothetical protein